MPWSRVNTEYIIHRVQHTPSTAYTEYSIHRSTAYTEEQHTPSTAYTVYCIIPRSTVSRSHLSADHVVLNSLHSHNHELTNQWSVSSRRASLPNYRLQIDRLQVLLRSRSITASKCISSLARLRPPISLDHGLQLPLQTRSIMASNLARSQPPSASLNSLDHSLQVNL